MRITTAEIAIRHLQRLPDPGLRERVGDAQQRRLDPAVPGLRQHARTRSARSRGTGTSAASRRTPISRRRPARPICTWPARPEDASIPLKATSTSGNANTRSSSDGDAGDRRRVAAARRARTAARGRAPPRAPAGRGRRARAPPRARSAAAPPPRMASSATNSTIAAPIRNSVSAVVELAPEQRRGSPWSRTRTARRGSGSPGRSPSRR